MLEIEKCPKCGNTPKVLPVLINLSFEPVGSFPENAAYTMECRPGYQCCKYSCLRTTDDDNNYEQDKEEIERLIANYNQWAKDGGKYVYREQERN